MCCIVTRTDNIRESSHTKLNLEIVKNIRNSEDKMSVLAKKYGVHKSTIEKIKNNRSWHI